MPCHRVAVSPHDFHPSREGNDFYIMLNDMYVLSARPFDGFPQASLSLSDPQRTWAGISLTDVVNVRLYDPFSEGGSRYLATVNAQVGFAVRKGTSDQLDQDELADHFIRNYENQLFAPGQRVVMDWRSVPLIFVIQSVALGDLNMEKNVASETMTIPTARGILVRSSQIAFFKDAKSNINLKASKRRPAANAILQPTFKFEDMGIGGLDKEFSAIFRRAFQSRILPPGLVQNMGIQYVKGILLYGPPGTGKTLIARKIGQMLNAREPKVINGPEVLNKYVGQSEENIRKLFADAEKEYKEKGDESELHIIIFDELDAVCKQRGSGAGGGTGVGDSVVNQLLSKLDGVDQLNNILLIGMTNRKDMIDDALLRPGRLEVHMEISLPDEHGRLQILKIHTTQMAKNGHLDSDVDLPEIAQRSKNFSGAEINGLIRSATSWAVNRHIKVGTMAQVSDDIEHMTVTQNDFDQAFDEVKPAFGVSEGELRDCLGYGIVHYSPAIDTMLEKGQRHVNSVRQGEPRLFTSVLYGPAGSGKTALAAKIALDSGFPFIKLISPADMIGFNEPQKINYIQRIFEDAYKSPLSVIVVDNLERILSWASIGPRFENAVLQALMVLVQKLPPQGRRLLVLATTRERAVLDQLGLFAQFNAEIAVPTVRSLDELAHVLRELQVLGDGLPAAMRELQGITGGNTVGVGIKDIYLAVQEAKQTRDLAGQFAAVMAEKIARVDAPRIDDGGRVAMPSSRPRAPAMEPGDVQERIDY